MRGDETRSYFFTLDEVEALFGSAGMRCVERRYVRRRLVNRAQASVMHRCWVHLRFVKEG